MRTVLFVAAYAVIGALVAVAVIEIFGLSSCVALPLSFVWLALVDPVGQGFGMSPILRRNPRTGTSSEAKIAPREPSADEG